jgi:hypothetical protein
MRCRVRGKNLRTGDVYRAAKRTSRDFAKGAAYLD